MGLNTVLLDLHDDAALLEVNLVALGAASGLLWRSPTLTLAGLGDVTEVPLGLRSADALDSELKARRGSDEVRVPGSGPIAFAALPFDREATGTAQLPDIILGEVDGQRFLTAPDALSVGDVEEMVKVVLDGVGIESVPKMRISSRRPASSWRDDVVGTARDHLVATGMGKAVLARQLTLVAEGSFPVARIVRDLDRRFPEAMVFAIDGFIGASPELLVGRSDRSVRAHPLAGTTGRSSDPDIDRAAIDELRGSVKDRTEHQITIDWLLAELLPFCSYVDAEPEPSVVSMVNVHHLGTLVEGVLSAPPVSVVDLAAAVHPTPALGGEPQELALQLIRELEGFDRGRYGGPAGWVDGDGNGEFAVSVRTASIEDDSAVVCAGVGVVAQSDPEAELLETQAKFRAMLGSLLNPA